MPEQVRADLALFKWRQMNPESKNPLSEAERREAG